MERNESKEIAINCLLEKSPAKDFYADTFERYLGTMNDESIPISPLELDNVSDKNNQVYINENVYNELMRNMNITIETDHEIPYFMIGFKQNDGKIVFEYIISDINNTSSMEADHNNITYYVTRFLKNMNYEEIEILGKPIICKGHTHGKRSSVSDNYSFGDMISTVSFKNQVRNHTRDININRVNPQIVDTVDMLMNPCGDFNIIYYDDNPKRKGFYKFTNIFLKRDNGNIELLPSISENGNYIKNGRNR